jgi:pyrroline-5-carboxylate reductase
MNTPLAPPTIAFIGGGNMAGALISGLLKAGHPAGSITVVEPVEAQADRLRGLFGIEAAPAATPGLSQAALIVWAVKPQSFAEAAAPCAEHVAGRLQLSVMAGIRSEAIARAARSQRVVRAMPNTPALVGRGMSGLYARPEVSPMERALVESLLAPTGDLLWVDDEAALDAVTALSGSGPAYVFYFLEAMVQAGQEMGLSADQSRRLAAGTFAGATAQVQQSDEPLELLRQRVTSKGGTTHAALTAMEAAEVKRHFIAAMQAARTRATELGDEFGS